ncbi:hypothetical protein [Brucella pituitosa]|uniref:hypothetical protein n=1 Tax=Brucella pituitosa TaxID=571256 RepID=UPI0015E436B8
MYSYEDRMRAVALYIKLGKRAKAAICQLGYPSKNALKRWCREYKHLLDLRLGFAPRAPKFTQAQKEAGVVAAHRAFMPSLSGTTKNRTKDASLQGIHCLWLIRAAYDFAMLLFQLPLLP